MPLNTSLFKEFDRFVLGIKSEDVVALMHDRDPDGFCSGVILAKLVERLRGKQIDLRINAVGSDYSLMPSAVASLKRNKVTVLIISDISADHEPDLIRKVSKFARVLIVDHHKHYHSFKEKNILLVKPQLLGSKVDPSSYATSKLAYDLASRVANMRDCDWLAVVGSIGDIATKPWDSWVTSVFRKYQIKRLPDLFKTGLGKVAITINNAVIHNERHIPAVFKTVYEAKRPEDVVRSPLRKYSSAVDKEIQKWVREADRRAERLLPDLIVYSPKPKFQLKSTLSTILSFRYPNKTLILLGPDGDKITVSARRQDRKVAVNALLECAIKGIKGASAGGHIPAAGGRFPKKALARFKRQLLECCR